MHISSLAALFVAGSGHSWPAFAFGALAGLIVFFVVPKLRKRKEP